MSNATKILSAATYAILIFSWIYLTRSAYPLITLVAVSIHEAGHVLASFACESSLNALTFQWGGLRLSGNFTRLSYASEAIIAFAGPFFNVVSALAFASAVGELSVFFRQVSIALAFLNLLPIREFDGGRILHSLSASFLPLKYCEKICDIFSFLALFFIWNVSVYATLKTGKSVSAFIFSIIIFFKITADDFKRLSKNNQE